MRQHGIEGKLRGRKKRTTIPDEAAIERARDLLQRDFAATGAEREVGLRHHLPAHLERLPLPRLRARLLQPDDRRLAARHAHAHRARPRRARDGQRPPSTRRGADRALGPRLAVHQHPLHRPARRARRRHPRSARRATPTTTRWPKPGSRPSRQSSSTAAASRASSTPSTRPCTGSASTTQERLHEALGDVPPAEYEELEYQDRQQPNRGRHLTTPPTNPGWTPSTRH